MKNIFNKISPVWRLFSEFSGVIATIGYILIGITYLNALFRTHRILVYVLILFFPFVFFTLVRLLRSSWSKLTTQIEQIEIQNDVNKYETIRPTSDINHILPNTNLLMRWYRVLMNRAKEWSEDVTLDSLNVYIDVGNQISIVMMGHATSDWKSESAYFRLGKNFSVDRQENVPSSRAAGIRIPSVNPFFIKYPLWRSAVVKAYNSISGRLPSKYQISFSSHYSYAMRFSFDYYERIRREEAFEFNGLELRNLKTDKTINIRS